MRNYYVCMMASRGRTLYIGVTSDLTRRVYEHMRKVTEGFTKKYSVNKLVFYETTTDVEAAIAREKQLKAWRRSKKVTLVESDNPEWKDLALHWYDSVPNA